MSKRHEYKIIRTSHTDEGRAYEAVETVIGKGKAVETAQRLQREARAEAYREGLKFARFGYWIHNVTADAYMDINGQRVA
jgi:hypothetical protein